MRLELGGPGNRRVFETFSQGTLEHDLFVMERVRKAGLRDLTIAEGEVPEEFAERVLNELVAAGCVFDLVAAWLVPEGGRASDWSPALAQETGSYLRKLEDLESKAAIRYRIVELLLDFFVRGTARLWTSGRSFSADRPDRERADEAISLESGERSFAK